jgi:hypothetical protein
VKALQRRGLRTLRDRLEKPAEKTFGIRVPLGARPAMTGVR